VATHVRDLAASGAIVITRAARDRLRGDFAPIFEDKGESRVPGIAHPVRSFQIAPVDECGVARRRLRARTILVGGLAIGVGVAAASS
jgi:class 3 adenylate cyclase